MKEEELRQYFDIYTACWKLFRKYSAPVDSDAFWDGLISDADRIAKNFGNTEFAKKIIVATADEIEKLCKKSE